MANGLIDGQGKFTWKDGKNYVGRFKEGKLHGEGIVTFANGTQLTGIWQDGENQQISKVISPK